MAGAAWHLLVAAWDLALRWMGTTTLAVLYNLFAVAITLFVRLWTRGAPAMMQHWRENLGWGVGGVLIFWFCIIAWATVRQTYIDHITAWSLINGSAGKPGLAARVEDLTAQIDGPNGY